MQNGLLICSGSYTYKNIGDYIQSVAAEQFYDKVDVLVEREELNNFHSEEKTKVIINGWFMRNPQNWPPSKDIIPLYISMHIVPEIADDMLNFNGVNYLKRYAPIGCRDRGTMEILRSKGVDCYYSACLTLTLGIKYKSYKRNSIILFVDPYYDVILRRKKGFFRICIEGVLNVFNLFINWKVISEMKRRNVFKYEFYTPLLKISSNLHKLWCLSAFYNTYKTLFDDEVLLSAEYITHNVPQNEFRNDFDKLEYARSLIRKYAKSKLVITSRIHCGLPCLGLETPVLFVLSDELQNTLRSHGRFGGIIDLFYVIYFNNRRLNLIDSILKNKLIKGKISSSFIFDNKSDFLYLKEKLIMVCKTFMKNDRC